MASRPLVLPEPFSGEGSWVSWLYHFESIADVNDWDNGKKLKWLKVRLTGKAQTAFQRLPAEARGDYEEAKKALQERSSRRIARAGITLSSRPVLNGIRVLGRFCRQPEESGRQGVQRVGGSS